MDREASFWSVIPHTVLAATDIKPNAKLLYAKVTSLQTAKGYCYASNRYLAEGLGIAPDTVTRLLKELSDAGYLRLEIIRDGNNAILERRVYPTIKLPVIDTPPGQTSDTPIGQTSDTLSDKHPSREYRREYSKENPPIVPRGDKRRREPKKQPDHKPERFEKFWKYYPRRESKQAAIRAWDRLSPSDDLIDTMAKALKCQMQTDEWQRGIGIPYASTWLNNARWEDEVKATAVVPEMDTRGGLPVW